MKFYLVKLLTNTKGQDGSALVKYDSLDKARVAYHSILASFHNAADVLYASVSIVNENGSIEQLEIVDHRSEPEEAVTPTETDVL